MIYLTFLAAFLLSGIAGYYSVVGLALIFPGSFWPVVVMGGALEFSKLVTASWLYRNWSNAPKLLKYYLTTAVVILMLITSMGIFGFLSKAHIEHSTDTAPIADKVAVYDEKINLLKQQIDENKRAIAQMDESVNQVLSRSTSEKSALTSVQIRKSQQKERTRLTNENLSLQQQIATITEEKIPFVKELRKNEADFGPIKYVAELIYGNSDQSIIDKSVRLVIMIIMLVFDPLAVLLLVSANISMRQKYENGAMVYEKETVRFQNEPVENDEPTVQEKPTKKIPKKKKVVEVSENNITTVADDGDVYIIDPDDKGT